MSEEGFFIWEGVYKEFPEQDPECVFESDHWVEKIAARAEESLRNLEANVPIPEHAVVHEYPLPVLAALTSARFRKPIRILDFGGGLGATYFSVAASMPDREQFEFYVVEGASICRKGRVLFENYSNIHFYEKLPEVGSVEIDIVHAASSFQYLKSWQDMLERFAQYNPQYIAFGNLLAGAIRPFVTYQNYYGNKIPVRFYNIDDVMSELEKVGYEVIYKSLLRQSLLGKRQPLPMGNMPEECRLPYGCNLICERKAIR